MTRISDYAQPPPLHHNSLSSHHNTDTTPNSPPSQNHVSTLSEHLTPRRGYTTPHKPPRNQVISELIKNHDRFVAPDYEEDYPTEVSVQLYVSSVDTVSEQNMEYSVTILLRQLWHDPRLNYTRMSSLARLEMDSSRINNFWVPDLFFSNEKKGSFHDVTKPNRMLLIYRNGTVFYSIRLSLTLSCYMRLERYPMDDQICSMVMESYSYSAENVFFRWIETQKPVVVDKSIEMPQYTLKKYDATVCKKDYGEVFYLLLPTETNT
ncbi:glycine receptor subunit alpha-4-like [Octopus bimaculoides]|uniref:glycine receptor subunit alpha-4-like n=1 Tax=Octopus bimaculoides TaxID=37653 RepID=UPI0022E75736|nr:glycine receptor subunit alpha-4-like [Octopus bimaculoides]